jgi:hypothetical protein
MLLYRYDDSKSTTSSTDTGSESGSLTQCPLTPPTYPTMFGFHHSSKIEDTIPLPSLYLTPSNIVHLAPGYSVNNSNAFYL